MTILCDSKISSDLALRIHKHVLFQASTFVYFSVLTQQSFILLFVVLRTMSFSNHYPGLENSALIKWWPLYLQSVSSVSVSGQSVSAD